jgi:glycerophosphoryl diester phosphodiesterase
MQLSPFTPLDSFFAPAPEPGRVAFLSAQPFAHRGLHGSDIVENSRSAFDRAVALNHGIELDIQPSREGVAFVFHDDDLDRLTAERGPIIVQAATDLDTVRLTGTRETIPRLTEIIGRIAGRVPVLIEIKTDERYVGVLCLSVRRALEGYRGPHAIMSFNPQVSRWFADHSPRTVRGLVMTEGTPDTRRARLTDAVVRRLTLWRAKPDFLAYDIRNLPSRFASEQRARGLKLLTWTVRTAAQERIAMACADESIYEKPGVVANG